MAAQRENLRIRSEELEGSYEEQITALQQICNRSATELQQSYEERISALQQSCNRAATELQQSYEGRISALEAEAAAQHEDATKTLNEQLAQQQRINSAAAVKQQQRIAVLEAEAAAQVLLYCLLYYLLHYQLFCAYVSA